MTASVAGKAHIPPASNSLVDRLDAFIRPEERTPSKLGGEVWRAIESALPGILEHFYADLSAEPELADIFAPFAGSEGALRHGQAAHWQALLNDTPNLDFQTRSVRIAEAHVRIGLPSRWYLAAYGRVLTAVVPAIFAHNRLNPRKAEELITALISRVFLDICLAQDGYENGTRRRAEERSRRDTNLASLRSVADTIVSINDIALNMTTLQAATDEATSNSQSISAAAEELVASVDQIAANSDGAAELAQETNRAVNQSVEAMTSAAASIAEIARTSDDSARSLTELHEASEQISSILSVIEAIADQTNLLALNATIEAARAGEAGKGFAVVASEVKSLANQAARATEDISDRITALKRGMNVIERSIDGSRRAVEHGQSTIDSANGLVQAVGTQISDVNQRMHEISAILQQQKATTSEISTSITGVADRAGDNRARLMEMNDSLQSSNDAFLDNARGCFRSDCHASLVQMAKIDHILFKKRVVDIVAGRVEGRANDMPDHHSCRLGRWYDSLPVGRIRSHPAYAALAEPHEAVHRVAHEILDLHDAGRIAEAHARLEELEHVGKAVIASLNTLSHAVDEELSGADSRSHVRREAGNRPATAKLSDREVAIVIRDVSDGGIGISGPNLGQAGRALQIELDGRRVLGEIVWSKDNAAGIRVLTGGLDL